jgi:hypothetical protein
LTPHRLCVAVKEKLSCAVWVYPVCPLPSNPTWLTAYAVVSVAEVLVYWVNVVPAMYDEQYGVAGAAVILEVVAPPANPVASTSSPMQGLAKRP